MAEVKVIICWSTAVRVEYARSNEPVDTEVPYILQGRTGPYDIDGKTTYVQIQEVGLNSPLDPFYQGDKDYQKEFYLANTDADLFGNIRIVLFEPGFCVKTQK